MVQYYRERVRRRHLPLCCFCAVWFMMPLPDIQVRELKASLQQNHHEDETREEGERFNTGEEIQRVNTTYSMIITACSINICVIIWSLWKLLSQAGHGDESELVKVKEEAQELRAQNDLLTRRGQHQREEIKRLNQVTHLTSSPAGSESVCAP